MNSGTGTATLNLFFKTEKVVGTSMTLTWGVTYKLMHPWFLSLKIAPILDPNLSSKDAKNKKFNRIGRIPGWSGDGSWTALGHVCEAFYSTQRHKDTETQRKM